MFREISISIFSFIPPKIHYIFRIFIDFANSGKLIFVFFQVVYTVSSKDH